MIGSGYTYKVVYSDPDGKLWNAHVIAKSHEEAVAILKDARWIRDNARIISSTREGVFTYFQYEAIPVPPWRQRTR
jgi:hypothetical protein